MRPHGGDRRSSHPTWKCSGRLIYETVLLFNCYIRSLLLRTGSSILCIRPAVRPSFCRARFSGSSVEFVTQTASGQIRERSSFIIIRHGRSVHSSICPYVLPSLCPSLRPSIRSPARPSVRSSVPPSVSPSVRSGPYVRPSIRSVHPSVRSSVRPSVPPTVRRSVRPSVH